MEEPPRLPWPKIGDVLRDKRDGHLARVTRSDEMGIDLKTISTEHEQFIGLYPQTRWRDWEAVRVHALIDATALGDYIGYKVWSKGDKNSHRAYGYHELLDVWIEEDEYGYEHVIGTINLNGQELRNTFPKGASLAGVSITDVEVEDLGGQYIIYEIRGAPRTHLVKRAPERQEFPSVRKGDQEWYALFAL